MDVRSIFAHDLEAVRIGKLHGADRAHNTSYLLTDVIAEYRILREVIFHVLETDGPLEQTPRDIIYESIEQAVNDAAVNFSEVHAGIQQKFINTLTHDLRNPVACARISAEMILRTAEKPSPCAELADRIVRSLGRVTSMIDDLLDAGKLRAGEDLSLRFEHCDLAAVLRDVVDEMNASHQHRFHLVSPGSVVANWSCDGLRRAVENLLDNAVKYGKSGAPIHVSLERTAEGTVLIRVHNEGTPIATDEIPLLFEQYRRSKSAQEINATGWGIGLALVKGVVEAHRGQVRIESEAEKGTTFTLEIPTNALSPSTT